MTATNRHPADQLADVRAQIAALKEREDTLRHDLMLPGASLQGDDFVAEIATSERTSLDGPAVRKEFGDERLKRWLKTTKATTVRVKPRVHEDGDET